VSADWPGRVRVVTVLRPVKLSMCVTVSVLLQISPFSVRVPCSYTTTTRNKTGPFTMCMCWVYITRAKISFLKYDICTYPFSKENLVRENLTLACIFVVFPGLFFCFCVCVKCVALCAIWEVYKWGEHRMLSLWGLLCVNERKISTGCKEHCFYPSLCVRSWSEVKKGRTKYEKKEEKIECYE